MTEPRILIANASLSAEAFDGEIVLLDVVRGLYFSLSGAAIELWRAFGEPRDAGEVTEALCARLAGADRAALEEAIRRMRENGLLAPVDEPTRDGTPLTVPAATYIPPGVEAFSDLADLISIDPVHEVDAATGWPVKPENFPRVD